MISTECLRPSAATKPKVRSYTGAQRRYALLMASSSIWELVSETSLKPLEELLVRAAPMTAAINVMTYSSPHWHNCQRALTCSPLNAASAASRPPAHAVPPGSGHGWIQPTAEQTRLRGGIRIKHTCLPGGNPASRHPAAEPRHPLRTGGNSVGGLRRGDSRRIRTARRAHTSRDPRIVAQPVSRCAVAAGPGRCRLSRAVPRPPLSTVGIEPLPRRADPEPVPGMPVPRPRRSRSVRLMMPLWRPRPGVAIDVHDLAPASAAPGFRSRSTNVAVSGLDGTLSKMS